MARIPLFILPEKLSEPLSQRLLGIGAHLAPYVPHLKYDLREIAGPQAHEYLAVAILNTLAWAVGVFAGLLALLFLRNSITLGIIERAFTSPDHFNTLTSRLYPASLGMVLTSGAIFLLFMYYPRILARSQAESVDRDLIYALKDLLLQLSSGVTLFNALVNVANSGYGVVSKHFDTAVKDVNGGEAIDRALERMAARTESEFMRRAVWQMVTALRGGASLEGALKSIIEVLQLHQGAAIRRYVSELNLWSLIFLIFAVAVPGLGSTVLIVISAFGGVRVNEVTYMTILALSFFMEIIIIGLIKSRRPAVQL